MKLLGLEAILLDMSSAGLIAQMESLGTQPSGWLSVVIQAGSFGLVAYLIIQGLPALQREIKSERAAERKDFNEALNSLVADRRIERTEFAANLLSITDAFRKEAEAMRTSAKAEMDAARTTFVVEQRETRSFYATEAESLRKVYVDAVADMRTAVHDVRDVASVTMNRANLAVEMSKVGSRP